jgi:hypothetical protein
MSSFSYLICDSFIFQADIEYIVSSIHKDMGIGLGECWNIVCSTYPGIKVSLCLKLSKGQIIGHKSKQILQLDTDFVKVRRSYFLVNPYLIETILKDFHNSNETSL